MVSMYHDINDFNDDEVSFAYKMAISCCAEALGMTNEEYENKFFGGTLKREKEFDNIWHSLSFEEKEKIIAKLCC